MKAYLLAGLAGAALAASLAAGIWLYGSAQYRAGQAACKEAQRVESLEQFQVEAEKLTGLADMLHEQTQALSAAKPTVIERYTRVEVEKPLPAGCVFDAGRLQRTNDGISTANSASQLAPALPSGSNAGN